MRNRVRHLAWLVAGAALLALIATLSGGAGVHGLIAPALDAPETHSEAGAASTEILSLPDESSAVPSAPSIHLDPLETRLLDLLNTDRVARGLPSLDVDARLVELARARSRDMATRDYFGHLTPEGTMVFDMMDRAGIPYRLAGENLARNTYPPDRSPDVAHQGFMDSPTHAENDYDPIFNKIGIGVARSGKSIYFTELFVSSE